MKPPILAVFLVVFDQKVGYTVKWHRTVPDLDITGVEYKCLPSGLHSVRDDIIYFKHGAHFGISAFQQAHADASERNASFVAVGALVVQSSDRLGHVWAHSSELNHIARQAVTDRDDHGVLEEFWQKHGRKDDFNTRKDAFGEEDAAKSNGKDIHALSREVTNGSDHPALVTWDMLEFCGPLLFPLYRAALLRQRILFLGSPPVHETCRFIYMLSLLADIPITFINALAPDREPLLQTRPLYSVSITDIPQLQSESAEHGWIACSTDDILGEKRQLWDVLVRLPKAQETGAGHRIWPKIETSKGAPVRASQRDFRRFKTLRAELARRSSPTTPSYRYSTTPRGHEWEVLEPLSWSATAYNSFLWWASAGDEFAWNEREAQFDRDILDAIPTSARTVTDDDLMSFTELQTNSVDATVLGKSQVARTLAAFMHHTTSRIFHVLTEAVQEADEIARSDSTNSTVAIDVSEIPDMGLDNWHESDKAFVMSIVKKYFGRDAQVTESGLRLCGLKIG